ncbi:hypothetical protein GIS00_18475 [Nakamurella sp. YIM 132087]|uniref:Uncharacterized protein n=1 Tax=Nakamurella alba TaxID=2665158 RepID=A0A7K1FSX6_9ACTN|nr:hypothetical protein [Nakamurella alba]MTD15924.1 hypothetical protein [Nakamurella alba]
MSPFRLPAAVTALVTAALAGTALALAVPAAATTPDPAATPDARSAAAAPLLAEPGVLAAPARSDQVYVPITPCRVVDTRSAFGPLGSQVSRNYYVSGSFGIVSQGGRQGGCGIPENATAVAATMTAVDPAAVGFARAWPAGSPEPAATQLQYRETNGTGVVLTLRPGSAAHLTVRNYGGPTDLVLDVAGYWAPQMQASVSAAGVLSHGTSRVVSIQHTASSGAYKVTFDAPVTSCSPQVETRSLGQFASLGNPSGGTVTVYLWTLGSDGAPDLNDAPFHLTVTC